MSSAHSFRSAFRRGSGRAVRELCGGRQRGTEGQALSTGSIRRTRVGISGPTGGLGAYLASQRRSGWGGRRPCRLLGSLEFPNWAPKLGQKVGQFGGLGSPVVHLWMTWPQPLRKTAAARMPSDEKSKVGDPGRLSQPRLLSRSRVRSIHRAHRPSRLRASPDLSEVLRQQPHLSNPPLHRAFPVRSAVRHRPSPNPFPTRSRS